MSIIITLSTPYSKSLNITKFQYYCALYAHRCYTESIQYSTLFLTLFILFLFGNSTLSTIFNQTRHDSPNDFADISNIYIFYIFAIALAVALSFCILLITSILGKIFQLVLFFTGYASTQSVDGITLHELNEKNTMKIVEDILSGLRSILLLPLVYILANIISANGYPVIGTHYVYNPFSFMGPVAKLFGQTVAIYYGSGSEPDIMTDVFRLQDIELSPSTHFSKILQFIVICIFASRLFSIGGILCLLGLVWLGIYSATPKSFLSGLKTEQGETIYPDLKLSGLNQFLFNLSQGHAVQDGLVSGIVRRFLMQFAGLDTWILNPLFQNEYLTLSTKTWTYLKWLIVTCIVIYGISNIESFVSKNSFISVLLSFLFVVGGIVGLWITGWSPVGTAPQYKFGLTGNMNKLLTGAMEALGERLGWATETHPPMSEFPGHGLTKFTDVVRGYTGNIIEQIDRGNFNKTFQPTNDPSMTERVQCKHGPIQVVPSDMAKYLEQLKERRNPLYEQWLMYCDKIKYKTGVSCPLTSTSHEYVESLAPSQQKQQGGSKDTTVQFELILQPNNTRYGLRGLTGDWSTKELTMNGRNYEWTPDQLRQLVENRMREIEATYGDRYMPTQFVGEEKGHGQVRQQGQTGGYMYVDGVPLVIMRNGHKKLVGLNGELVDI